MKPSYLGSTDLKIEKVASCCGEAALCTVLGTSCSKKACNGLKEDSFPAESFVLD